MCDVRRAAKRNWAGAMQMKRRIIKDSSLRLSSGKWPSSISLLLRYSKLAPPLLLLLARRIERECESHRGLILDAGNFFSRPQNRPATLLTLPALLPTCGLSLISIYQKFISLHYGTFKLKV